MVQFQREKNITEKVDYKLDITKQAKIWIVRIWPEVTNTKTWATTAYWEKRQSTEKDKKKWM